jgi:hypothetical protein
LPLLGHADKDKVRIKQLAIMGAMTIAVVFTLSHVVREAKFLPQREFEQTLSRIPGTASVQQWLPVWASATPRKMNVAVEAGDRDVVVNSWTPESRSFAVAAGNATEARVKTFYYPHWTAKSGQQLLRTRPDTDGALSISLPSQAATIDLNFVEPRRSHVSTFASCAGFILIGVLALPFSWRRKQ